MTRGPALVLNDELTDEAIRVLKASIESGHVAEVAVYRVDGAADGQGHFLAALVEGEAVIVSLTACDVTDVMAVLWKHLNSWVK